MAFPATRLSEQDDLSAPAIAAALRSGPENLANHRLQFDSD